MGSTLVVEIGGLSGALSAIVNDYVKTETEKANAAVEIGAKVCRAQIAATAPRKTGEYAAGWRTKVEESYGAKTATVYQSKKPGLPHLLEKGHGGPKPAGAKVHITPAFEAGKAAMLAALE